MKFLSGNLLDVNDGIIVHGCNCQGVWGSGVAKQMKEKYPEAFTKYQSDLKNLGSTALGRISVWGSMNPVTVHSAFT
jgi:O-acetyl-ADP-ribose deacetylase (regulator of RNase III)